MSAPKVVLLGMMTKMPVAGVAWQNLHYLLGFERLGCEAYYVETHARTPSMLMKSEEDDSSALAAEFIAFADAALRDGRPLGLPGPARRWPLLRDERSGVGTPLRLRRPADQPPRGDPAAARAGGDRPAGLPGDRSGSAPARAPARAAGDGRLPRAAQRLLHLRRELGQPRLPAAAQRALRLPSHQAAGPSRPLARPLPAAGGRLHHDRQLAPGLARGQLRRQALLLEQAPAVPRATSTCRRAAARPSSWR